MKLLFLHLYIQFVSYQQKKKTVAESRNNVRHNTLNM